jgi:tryptophanyl-tRNA synthetase
VKDKRKQILDLAKAYLAAGVDPKQSVIFDQADVPAHFELNWILDTLTPITEVERMTQFKDKSAKNAKNINLGLLSYPVLQAADILIYHATKVPVGIDQVQHVELTRKCARWFNNRFGQYFLEPDPVLTNIPKVQSLTDPTKKMSKSDGAASYIALLDSPELIQKKIRKAVTGSGTEDTIPPGAENLLMIIDELGHHEVREKYLKQIKDKTVRYSELKDEVAQIIGDHFDNFRHIYKNVSDTEVEKILKHGAEQANEVANKTIKEVRKLIGVK